MKKIKYLILIFIVLSLSNNNCKIFGYNYPGEVDVVYLHFNYNTASYSADALSIKANNSSSVFYIEWAPPTLPSPFAYIKNQTNRKFQAKFVHNQNINYYYTLKIYVNKDVGIGIGNSASKEVYFPSNNNGYSEVATFQLNGSVPSAVGINQFKFYWFVGYVNGEATHLDMGYTGWHKHYTLLAAPQAPMTTPWTIVLDYACVWASGKSTETSVLTNITEGAFYNFDVDYDGGQTHAPGNSF